MPAPRTHNPGLIISEQKTYPMAVPGYPSNDQIGRNLKDWVKDVVDRSVVVATEPSNVKHLIRRALQQTLDDVQCRNEIKSYCIDDINVVTSDAGPFHKVTGLLPGILPGDPYVVVHADGEEEYRGVIISNDGHGNGVVFHEPAPNTTKHIEKIDVKIRVQPRYALEYITVEFESKHAPEVQRKTADD